MLIYYCPECDAYASTKSSTPTDTLHEHKNIVEMNDSMIVASVLNKLTGIQISLEEIIDR